MVATSLIALLFLATSVVGVQTYEEYETWKDQEFGVLEHVFAFTTADLEPVPKWRCIDPPTPVAPGVVTVQTYWDLPSAPQGHVWWADEVAQRLPVALGFQPLQPTNGLEDAWAHARAHPDQIVIVFTDQHYRGPVLNDRLEGFACGNIAVINTQIDCPESIVAHEIGHVLGLRHTPSGLMRARGVACDDQLVERQSQWLKANYIPVDEGFLPRIVAEPTEPDSVGNADAEPEPEPDVL